MSLERKSKEIKEVVETLEATGEIVSNGVVHEFLQSVGEGKSATVIFIPHKEDLEEFKEPIDKLLEMISSIPVRSGTALVEMISLQRNNTDIVKRIESNIFQVVTEFEEVSLTYTYGEGTSMESVPSAIEIEYHPEAK